MMLGCLSLCRGCMNLNSDQIFDEKNCKFNSPSLATNDKIELYNLRPTTAAKVVENISEDNEKGVDF